MLKRRKEYQSLLCVRERQIMSEGEVERTMKPEREALVACVDPWLGKRKGPAELTMSLHPFNTKHVPTVI